MVSEREKKLIEYLQEQAQNLEDFCERNEIKDFHHCGYTLYKSTNIHVNVSVHTATDKIDHICSRWKWRGEWEDIEVTT